MNYYDYEFEVLQKLHNKLQIKTISIDRESKDAIQKRRDSDGKLYDFIMYKYYGTKTITLNFKGDYYYKMDEGELRNAYENGACTSYVVEVIIRNVCNEFVNKFIKK